MNSTDEKMSSSEKCQTMPPSAVNNLIMKELKLIQEEMASLRKDVDFILKGKTEMNSSRQELAAENEELSTVSTKHNTRPKRTRPPLKNPRPSKLVKTSLSSPQTSTEVAANTLTRSGRSTRQTSGPKDADNSCHNEPLVFGNTKNKDNMSANKNSKIFEKNKLKLDSQLNPETNLNFSFKLDDKVFDENADAGEASISPLDRSSQSKVFLESLFSKSTNKNISFPSFVKSEKCPETSVKSQTTQKAKIQRKL